jgi:very-short-patch-repair endonuclease
MRTIWTHELAFTTMLRNAGVPSPMCEYRFDKARRFRFDYAWPEPYRVAVEIDGGVYSRGRHVRPGGYIRDCEKLNLAATQGWLVLRVPTQMLEDEPDNVLMQIKACLHQRGMLEV